jgi:hypothetical protein
MTNFDESDLLTNETNGIGIDEKERLFETEKCVKLNGNESEYIRGKE